MTKTKKLCFVIMGFGKKTDYSTGNTYDLDKTYKNIIQPSVQESGYECIRADEIQDSGLIDKSMYALLMHADLVIADITTFNPNAIYELGIRHAVRPFSTIILKEEDGKIPFDLDHTRIFYYKHLGEDIGSDESKRCQKNLKEKIKFAEENKIIDSPLYDYIKDIEPPKIPAEEFKKIVGELADREVHVFAIAEKAKELMNEGNFIEAIKYWEKASKIVPSEDFFIQQLALATYKSKNPTEMSSLSDALRIIEKLNPDDETKDPETLGLTGAIYKRQWQLTNDIEFLKRAKFYYGKGFQVRNDYYTGENFALCLNLLGSEAVEPEEKTYYKIAAKKVRIEILNNLKDIEENVEESMCKENKWAYATIANCYLGLGNMENVKKFEKIFLDISDAEWEKQTYKENKENLTRLLKEA